MRNFGIELECLVPYDHSYDEPNQHVARTAVFNAMANYGIVCPFKTANMHADYSTWKMVEDGTVFDKENFPSEKRNLIGEGIEIVSPILSSVNDFNTIRTVCKALYSVKAKVNNTCGLHVHIDVKDLSFQELKNIGIVYSNVASTMDLMMSENRRKSVWAGNEACDKMPRNFFYAQTLQDLYDIGRNRTVNYDAFKRQGTIEYRHHAGTIDTQKIVNWILFTQAFTEYGRKGILCEDNPESLFEAMNLPLCVQKFYFDRIEKNKSIVEKSAHYPINSSGVSSV